MDRRNSCWKILGSAGPFVGIFLAALAAYWPALHGGLLWDDNGHVTKASLRSLHGLWRIWFEIGASQQYYPVLHSAFWVEHRLWGDSLLGYHLVNVLLHATSACLLAVVLRRLAVPGALFAAFLFALHPVGVESVAWISEQKNTLSTVFYLLAMLAYLRWRGDEVGPGGPPGRSLGGLSTSTGRTAARAAQPYLYLLATLLFMLAVLSKTVTVTLPAALLLIAWWQRGRVSWRRDFLPLLPWFAAGASAGLLTAWVERRVIGAVGVNFDLSLVQRGLLAGRVVWFYLGKLLWPANLIFIYPHWTVRAGDPWWWIPSLAALAVTAVLVGRITCRGEALRRRVLNPPGRRTNADGANGGLGIIRPTLFAWAFFVLTLFPALGFVNVYPFVFSYVADHFQYLASLGIFALAAAAWARWTGSSRIVAAVLLAVLGTLTWRQARIYRNVTALYETTLDRNPDCWLAHVNLGDVLMQEGRTPEALAHFREALRLNPDYSWTHFNLAKVLMQEGQAPEAIAQFAEAARLNPTDAETHYDWGNELAQTGQMEDAASHYTEALRLRPDYPEAQNNLGSALLRLGRSSEAIDRYQQALRLRPDYPEAEYNLGLALRSVGRTEEADEHFARAEALQAQILR